MHARYLIILGVVVAIGRDAAAQSRVGADSSTRIHRLERDLGYGTLEGFGYAGIDQWRLNPPEWGTGVPGYGRRVASNVGEFWVQEIATEGLAAAMNRPLDYRRCRCRAFGARMAHALSGAIFDQMPRGRETLAVPRIVGAYAGAYAQSSWRPAESRSRTNITLTNGTTSLAIGALINMYHEFRR
jgi:hypothetical protein